MRSSKLGSLRLDSPVLVPWPCTGRERVLRRSSGAWLCFVLQSPVLKACGLSNLLETPADLPRVSQIKVLRRRLLNTFLSKVCPLLLGRCWSSLGTFSCCFARMR